MAHNVTPRVSTSPPSSIDAASRPRGSPPNETSSASKACSICAVVSASENGRPSSCKSARFTSSNDLSLPTTAGVKDMRPSLVKPARLQERSHAGRILGRKCLNAKTKPRPARQSSPSLHPQHMPLARASYRCALSTTETTSGSAIRVRTEWHCRLCRMSLWGLGRGGRMRTVSDLGLGGRGSVFGEHH